MKISISSFQAIAASFILGLFEVRTVVHVWHLRSKTKAQHDTFKEFYEALVDLTDRFAESAIGQFGDLDWPDHSAMFNINSDPEQLLKDLAAILQNTIANIPQEDLKNILTEMLELTTATSYKLTMR